MVEIAIEFSGSRTTQYVNVARVPCVGEWVIFPKTGKELQVERVSHYCDYADDVVAIVQVRE